MSSVAPDAQTFATLADRGDVVAIVGAGGKTTTMFALAEALAARGLRVVTTKSTAIHRPTLARSPGVFVVPPERWAAELPELLAERRVITVVTGAPSDRRWDGVPPELADELRVQAGADVAIVEADGARRRLLKAPAPHEPAMPPMATIVMPVASLRAVGKPLIGRHAHRPELVAEVLGIEPGTRLRGEHIAGLLLSPHGGIKSAPQSAQVWPTLTECEAVDDSILRSIVAELMAHPRVAGWVSADGSAGAWCYRAALRTHRDGDVVRVQAAPIDEQADPEDARADPQHRGDAGRQQREADANRQRISGSRRQPQQPRGRRRERNE